MTKALNPKVAEIKEKYADNKDLQNQMTALLYQETKVIFWLMIMMLIIFMTMIASIDALF